MRERFEAAVKAFPCPSEVREVEGKWAAYVMPEKLLELYGRLLSKGFRCQLDEFGGYGFVVLQEG